MDNCRFCPELNNQPNDFDKITNHIFRTRFIRESPNFVVFPTLGSLQVGHLLIVPKGHFLSFGHMNNVLFDEAETLLEDTRQILETTFHKSVIFFEHGTLSNHSRGGCCIDHAHIHAIPADVNLTRKLNETYLSQTINYLHELTRPIMNSSSYLFYEHSDRSRYLYNAPMVVSQYLRQLLAIELQIPEEWNWRTETNLERLELTLEKLRPWSNVKGLLDFSRVENNPVPICALE